MQESIIGKYLHKPTINNTRLLYNLYSSAQVNIPTVEDLILEQIMLGKHLKDSLKELIDTDKADADLLELCMLIDVDIENIKPISS